MLTRTNQIKCDACGQFIPFDDLGGGGATHHLATPDSHFSTETFESLCKKCNAKEKAA